MSRLDENGPQALLQLPTPVNKYPEFVAYNVRRLKVLCRAGLHLGSTTVRRMLAESWKRKPDVRVASVVGRSVRAHHPNQIWNVDLTTVPMFWGFWVPWVPLALPRRWPFCWRVAVAADHFYRRGMGVAAFKSQPSSAAVQEFLDRMLRCHRAQPEQLITDRGKQFTAQTFGQGCRRRGIRRRFGAGGEYGSIAIVERFIRSMKNECTRRILISGRRADFIRELIWFTDWFNAERPRSGLGARTPDEVFFGARPACRAPRFEAQRCSALRFIGLVPLASAFPVVGSRSFSGRRRSMAGFTSR